MKHLLNAICIAGLGVLIGCGRHSPCEETNGLVVSKNNKIRGFTARVDAAGNCLVRFENQSHRPTLLNTYMFGYKVFAGKGNQSYSVFPKVPKPMPDDWVVVAPGKAHEFTIATYSGNQPVALNLNTNYRVELYTPLESPPKNMLSNGAVVLKPFHTIFTLPDPC